MDERPDPIMEVTEHAAFRRVPRTGVIFVTVEAQKRGFSPDAEDWCNLGQGQPAPLGELGADQPSGRPRVDAQLAVVHRHGAILPTGLRGGTAFTRSTRGCGHDPGFLPAGARGLAPASGDQLTRGARRAAEECIPGAAAAKPRDRCWAG